MCVCFFGVGARWVCYWQGEEWKKEYDNDKGRWAKVPGVDEMGKQNVEVLICYVPFSNLASTLPELPSLELNGILSVGPALLVAM